MENEILLATNNEFYYDGVPSSSSYKSSSVNTGTTQAFASSNCIEDTSGASEYIFKTVGKVLTGTQVVMIILAVFCIFKGLSNMNKNKINNDELSGTEDELYGDEVYLRNDGRVRKKATLSYFVFSLMLFFGCGIINIIKNFAAKPIIYIYPEKETEVKIKVKNPEKLTCTYPKYENEWNVLANPNGDLIDLKTNRKLYALYWEGINTTKPNLEEGFIVEGEKVAEFLEKKLEILGLNEREAEEFIVYWLPLMEKNKYNYIRFETKEEIDENMGLEITPAPETLIRINMEFKGLRKSIPVKEQKLNKIERKGYTVVEWGGTRL